VATFGHLTLAAHPPTYVGFGRTGRTKRMNPTIAVHEALPSVGLHGLALAGYPPRR